MPSRKGEKASFLREAVRSLGIDAEVYGGRVEDMPHGRSFDAVSLRAVDKMQGAVQGAASRIGVGGWLVLLVSAGTVELPNDFRVKQETIPGSLTGKLVLATRV